MRRRLGNSIRLRLALNTSLLVAFCGLVFGGCTYLWLAQNLEEEAEAFALHEVDELGNVVAAAASEKELQERDHLLDGLWPEEGVTSLEVWSLDQRPLLWRSDGKPEVWDGLAAARRGEIVLETLGSEDALRAAKLVKYGREPRWIATTVVRHDRAEAALNRFVVSYGLALGTAILLCFVGSLLLVRRALKPVQELVEDTSQLSREGLGGRLALPGEGSELRELVLLLNGMLSRIEASFDQLTRFTAHAGHELRTPLARIRGEVETALTRGDADAQRECLGSVLEETEALSRVVTSLLELARGEPIDLATEPTIPFHELLTELVEQARVVGGQRGLSVTAPSGQRVLVRGSRPLLSRTVWNLLDNATKFAQEGGQIVVRLIDDEGCVVVEVADDGPGWGTDDPKAAFEPFFTGSASPERTGYGLGLALSRTIARRHGGELTASTDETLGGALLRLKLPREALVEWSFSSDAQAAPLR